MAKDFVTPNQYKRGVEKIKEYVDNMQPNVLEEIIFDASLEKIQEGMTYATNNPSKASWATCLFDIDVVHEIQPGQIVYFEYGGNEFLSQLSSNKILYFYAFDAVETDYNNTWTIPDGQIMCAMQFGVDINKQPAENKCLVRLWASTTNVTGAKLKIKHKKAIDENTFNDDVKFWNSISMNRQKNSQIGGFSIALGEHAEASSTWAIAMGNDVHARGSASISLGQQNISQGERSATIGYSNRALGNYSYSHGRANLASAAYASATGYKTKATGMYATTSGVSTTASGSSSVAEGNTTTASGDCSHAEGHGTIAQGQNQHVQGRYNIEDTANKYAHIVGNGTSSSAKSNAHTLDWEGNAWYAGDVQANNIPYTVSSKVLTTVPANDINNNINSDNRITVNNISINKDKRYYIEFLGTKKLCSLLISEESGNCIICGIGNYYIVASNDSTNIVIFISKINRKDNTTDTFTDLVIHEEENNYLDSKYLETDLVLQNSISMGRVGKIGNGSSAIGGGTTASGIYSHAEGCATIASGEVSHAEGDESVASGEVSHAEGASTIASGTYSHAEGNSTKASGYCSHAEGIMTTASANQSHAEGAQTTASGSQSHAEGSGTIASGECQHVQGKYNIADAANKYAHIVGNGSKTTKSNAHTLDWNGNGWYAGKLSQDGTPTGDTDLTTKKYVDDKIAGIVNSAPETLDTLKELSTALGDDPNFATTVATNIGKKVDKVDGMSLTHNDLTNELKANYDAAYAYSQAKHSYNDLTDKPNIPSINGLATQEYVDSKALPIIFINDENRTGPKLFPLLPEHNLVFIAGDAQISDSNGNVNIIYGLCYSDIQNDGSKLLTEYRTNKTAKINTSGILESFEYIDEYIKKITNIFKNATNNKMLTTSQTGDFEWADIPSIDGLATKNNPIFTGYMSLGRKEGSTIGIGSSAIGSDVVASGLYSHAEGAGRANGEYSHAEGYLCFADGDYSHAEGYCTNAVSKYQHVEGKYNIQDETEKYAHIVGNGISSNRTSNAYTLDWSGNGWYAGKLSQEGTPTDDKDLTNKKYVDDKTSMENVIYDGDGTGADVISDYWTGCPVSSGNGCWVINKQITFDLSKPNPYYLLCDNTLYSPKNSTFDETNSAWIYAKGPNVGTVFICNKYNNENKLVLPWDGVNSPRRIKLYTKIELAKAMFSGDYTDLSNKPTIPSIEGLATEEYVNNKVTDTATSLTNDPDIYLTKDKYQYVTGVNTVNNMIWLPSTDLPAFLKIHVYTTNCKMQCVFDTPVRWKIGQNPNEGTFKIVTDNIYEFILTYINGSWIGEVVTYSNTEYTPTNDADVTTKKYVDNLTDQATSEEVKNMLNTTLGGDYSGEKN